MQKCYFPIESILHPINHLSKNDIITELQNHGHPTCRVMDSTTSPIIQRSAQEAARELANHYIYVHNYSEPFFLT
jgi:hypothetical protein